MMTLEKHLEEKLKDEQFKKKYDEEKRLIELSLQLLDEREKSGLTQKELAKKANITQQQLSKIENGDNCTILTFIKVCEALKLKIKFGK